MNGAFPLASAAALSSDEALKLTQVDMSRIILDFKRAAPPPAAPYEAERLEPLRLERRAEARLDGPLEVESLFLDAALILREGAHSVPLSSGGGAALEIPAGTRLSLSARLGRPPHTLGGEAAIITQLEGRFSQPLELRCVLSTLSALQHIFSDAGLEALAARLSPRLKSSAAALKRRVASALPLSPARVDQWAGGVALTRFTARPEWRDGAWALRFAFSGFALIADRVRVPFNQTRLPAALLPTLHAELNALLRQPLASAQLHPEAIPRGPLTEALLGVVESGSGRLRLTAPPPALRLMGRTLNGGHLVIKVRPPLPLHLRAAWAFSREGDDLRASISEAQLLLGERRAGFDLDLTAPAQALIDAASGAPTGGAARFDLRISPRSSLGEIAAQIGLSHSLAQGVSDLRLDLRALSFSGEARGELDLGAGRLRLEALSLPFEANINAEGALGGGFVALRPERLEGLVHGALSADEAGWRLSLEGALDWAMALEAQLPQIPELRVETGRLLGEASGQAALRVRGRARATGEALRFISEETSLDLTLRRAALGLEGRRLTLPEGATLKAALTRGEIDTSGLGQMSMTLAWDLGSAGPIFSDGDEAIDLLDPSLRAWALEVGISPAGRLSVEGARGGLYDSGFLNALLNPAAEKAKWLEIIDAPAPLKPLAVVLRSFSPDLERALWGAHALAARIKRVLEAEGISTPGDALPAETLARLAARILSDDGEDEPTLYALISGVVAGRGLDWRAAERLIEARFVEHTYRYEVDRVLRWLDRLLSPASPPPALRIQRRPPLVEVYAFNDWPRAAEIYAAIQAPMASAEAARLMRLAPALPLEMIEALLEAESPPPALRQRLRFLLAIKKRVRLINEGFGGVGFVPQAAAIAFFLGDVLARRLPMDARLGDGLLNPEDVATLMQAGQAALRYDRAVQINQRMLLDYLARQPRVFALGALAEMGLNNPRVLTSALLALLNQDQGQMKQPLDLPALLSRLLGTQIPRREDYLAGGRWARESYYQALMSTAEYILEEAEGYFAFKQWIGEHRAAPARLILLSGGLAERAEALIRRADEVASGCQFHAQRSGAPLAQPRGPLAAARAAYEEAFAACRALLEAQPTAFHAPWLKAFWARNFEALQIRSVLSDIEAGIDETPAWFAYQTQGRSFKNQQARLEGVIEALYWCEADRARLKADPLARLLIDPPQGRYDFTIVSAMGVVTEGAAGAELAAAFERLEAAYGVRVVRADTATAETLEFNAARVEAAIAQVSGPYGLIGYSQGCANLLMAERRLLAGTPKQRAMIQRLRCRQLLFSAFNGSAHGTCSNQKLIRAIIDGERFLKHYQAVFSRPVIAAAHKVIYAALDARPVARVIGSVDSISHEGVIPLHRDGQFLDAAPTTTLRGVASPEIVPEALEMLANVFTVQVMGAPHDTQVTLDASVGRSLQVENAYIDALARAEIPSMPQKTHHWSPLLVDTEFITTARDRARHIYDGPKNRHVFPWVELNARLGIIAVAPERG